MASSTSQEGQGGEIDQRINAAKVEAVAVAIFKADRPKDNPYEVLRPDCGEPGPAWQIYEAHAEAFIAAWRVMRALEP